MIPDLVDIGALRIVLPYGRYLTSLEEVENTFVPHHDENRKEIWESFKKAIEIAHLAFDRVAGVWIGGSFITSEQTPHDIDVVFFVKEEFYQRALESNEDRFLVDRLLKGGIDKVDAYLVVVAPSMISLNGTPESQDAYIRMRGYWDQFWSKTRFKDDNDRWLYPAAGYLQVVIDGYDD